jgi:chloramphenicol 3-O phosphotransferase
MTGRLVAITGPAAVGKSTLARALQAELGRNGELWLVLELDVFARGLSREWIGMGRQRRGAYADAGFVYSRTNDGGVVLTMGADARRVLAAFHRSVAAVVRSGLNAVAETIVYDAADWEDWRDALRDVQTTWVRLFAPLDVLQARERADETRVFKGLAQGMMSRPPVGHYDVEADTSAETVDANVVRILAAVSNQRGMGENETDSAKKLGR